MWLPPVPLDSRRDRRTTDRPEAEPRVLLDEDEERT